MRFLALLLLLACATAADPAFTMVIDTTKPGSSASNQFTLPLKNGEVYNCTVDWGDGTAPEVMALTAITDAYSGPTHTYPAAATYTVRITENVVGGFPAIAFNIGGDAVKVLELANWGAVTWRTMAGAFFGCSNMTITATDAATAQTGAVTDFSFAWNRCASITSFPVIDTSSGTKFTNTWTSCSSLASFPLLDVSHGTNFRGAWGSCTGLTSFPLLDVSNGTNFGYTWYGCTSLTSFPNLPTGNGTDFDGAWWNSTALSDFPTLDLAQMTTGVDCFKNVTLTTASYSALLLDLAARNTHAGVIFNGGFSLPADGAATSARDTTLETDRGWTILDGASPQLVALTPRYGPRSGGTPTTLSVRNLTGVTGVTFNGIAAKSVVVVDASTITCKTPKVSVSGFVDVVVNTAIGPITLPQGFQFGDQQTIAFSSIGSLTGGSATLAATATSGLTVSFSVINGPAQISGTTLTVTGSGAITIAANQPGNASYIPAPQVLQTVHTDAPTVAIASSFTAASAGRTLPITLTFSHPVTGVAQAGCTLTKGTISSITGAGTTWTLNALVDQAVGETLTLAIAQDAAMNPWGYGNTASATWSIPIVTPPAGGAGSSGGGGGGGCGAGATAGLIALGLALGLVGRRRLTR